MFLDIRAIDCHAADAGAADESRLVSQNSSVHHHRSLRRQRLKSGPSANIHFLATDCSMDWNTTNDLVAVAALGMFFLL